MGAAELHLAHVRQEPAQRRKPRRTGDGDGGEFAELARLIYQDKRADGRTRHLLLALAYVVTMTPLGRGPKVWRATCEAMGPPVARVQDLKNEIYHDLPRYEPPGKSWGGEKFPLACRGPRLRPHPDGPEDFRNRMGICGERTHEAAVELDPVTGWQTNHYFCARHRDHLERVAEQVAEQNAAAPAPVPNRGGLLPSYFDTDWEHMYRWASHPYWEPPEGYGVCADDWPVPGRDAVAPPQHPRLRLVVGEGGMEQG